MSGKLDIIIGPMFSGKSVTLLQKLLVSAELGLKVLYINHTFDNRSEHIFSTHHPFLTIKKYDNIDFISINSLRGIRKEDYDVIGIDEGQFFDETLIEFCKIHVEKYKKHVIVVGLDSNYKREKFGHILDLVPLADSIKKLRPYCKDCGVDQCKALFSYKYTSLPSRNEVDIGGKDKYKPLCRKCYLSLIHT
jgi:thymidine kinase